MSQPLDPNSRTQVQQPVISWWEDWLDRLATLGNVVEWVWRKKLWWMVPLLLSLVLLAALVALQATPVGPLLYPIF